MRKLAIASVSFSAAVLCASFLPGMATVYAGAIAFFLFAALFLFSARWKFVKPAWIAALAAALAFLWFGFYTPRTTAAARSLSGETREIAAVLMEEPRSGSSFASAKAVLATEGLPSLGMLIYDTTYSIRDLDIGQTVFLTARLRPADMRYGEAYNGYAASGVYLIATAKGKCIPGEISNSLRFLPGRAKQLLLTQIERVFSGQIRVFMQSLLLGEKADFYMDPELEVAMSRSGIMHVVAVSGMHLSFLVGFVRILFGKGKRSSLLSLLLIWLFVLITGGSPSAMRAGFMQSLVLLAPLLERENDSLTSLTFALALLLLINPFSVRTASLQLSFAAVAGILFFSGRINEFLCACAGRYSEFRPVQAITGILATSISVMIFTVPVTALHFSSVQILSPLTNVLVLWAVSLCFCLGILACTLAFFSLSLAHLAAVPVGLLARHIIASAKLVSGIPFAALYTCGDYSLYWVVGVYALFILFYFLPLGKRTRIFTPAAISLASLVVLLLATKAQYNGYEAVFSAINVGQGQSIAVFSGEKTLLIDCGGILSAENAGDTAGQYLLSCGRDRVDLLLLTHLHQDHVNGTLNLMEYLPVDEIVISLDTPDDDGALSSILAAAERHGTRITWIGREAEAELGAISIRMSTPASDGDKNERCVMSVTSVGDYDMLVTGDAPKAVERQFLAGSALPEIDLLIVGHHGSKTATSEELLSACRNADAVISTGYNTFGHPSPETLQALGVLRSVHRTDEEGTVQMIFRG